MRSLLAFFTFLPFFLTSTTEGYTGLAFDTKCEGEETEEFFYTAKIDVDLSGSCPDLNQLLSMMRVVYEAIGRSSEEVAAVTSEDITIHADKVTLDPAFCSEPVVGDSDRRLTSWFKSSSHPASTASKWSFRGGGKGVLCYPTIELTENEDFSDRVKTLELEIEASKESQAAARKLLHIQQGKLSAEVDVEDEGITSKIYKERLAFKVHEEEQKLQLLKEVTEQHMKHGHELPKEVKEILEQTQSRVTKELEASRFEMEGRHGQWRKELKAMIGEQKVPLDAALEEFESEFVKKIHFWDVKRAKLQNEHKQKQYLRENDNLAKEQLAVANGDFYWILEKYRRKITRIVADDLTSLWTEYGGKCFSERPMIVDLSLAQVPTEADAALTDEKCNG